MCARIPYAVSKTCIKSEVMKVGARAHLSLMVKDSELLSFNRMVPFISVRKDTIKLHSFGGSPVIYKIWNNPSLQTKSNAFIRSMKMEEDYDCNGPSGQKPNCDSRKVRSVSPCRRNKMAR